MNYSCTLLVTCVILFSSCAVCLCEQTKALTNNEMIFGNVVPTIRVLYKERYPQLLHRLFIDRLHTLYLKTNYYGPYGIDIKQFDSSFVIKNKLYQYSPDTTGFTYHANTMYDFGDGELYLYGIYGRTYYVPPTGRYIEQVRPCLWRLDTTLTKSTTVVYSGTPNYSRFPGAMTPFPNNNYLYSFSNKTDTVVVARYTKNLDSSELFTFIYPPPSDTSMLFISMTNPVVYNDSNYILDIKYFDVKSRTFDSYQYILNVFTKELTWGKLTLQGSAPHIVALPNRNLLRVNTVPNQQDKRALLQISILNKDRIALYNNTPIPNYSVAVHGIVATRDSGAVVYGKCTVGILDSLDSDNLVDAFAAKIKANGTLEWYHVWGKPNIRDIYDSGVEMNDGSVCLAGNTSDSLFLSCYRIDGSTSVIENHTEKHKELIVYPCPGTEEILLQSEKELQGAKLQIYNMDGQLMYSYTIDNTSTRYNISSLTTQCYLVVVIKDNMQWTRVLPIIR